MDISTIHPIRIPFTIPIGPNRTIDRFAYAYLLDYERLCLIDTGVAGAEKVIETHLQRLGKSLADLEVIVLTHSHPDHIGAARTIQAASGAEVWAHAGEQAWIEDTERQVAERPVPGFASLVAGPVAITRTLSDGEILDLGLGNTLQVLHTPGHSAGSISLLAQDSGLLFSGDVLPQPGAMPIYEDIPALANSLARLARIPDLQALYSSWSDPVFGSEAHASILAGIRHLISTHDMTMRVLDELERPDAMELCRACIQALGLPPFAANPLVARSFQAHGEAATTDIHALLQPS